MSCIVDQMFPARIEDTSEDYTSFVFWREPVDDVQIDIDKTTAATSTSSPAKNGAVSETSKKGIK